MHDRVGLNGFVWWTGVVEDRNDPLKLGRLRVRILGWHTPDKNKIPTKDLPWAFPVQPITSSAISGVGLSPLGPVEGTWVLGFFRDGVDAQDPVVLGTFGGIPEEVSEPTVGFSDPTGQYPRQDYINEADTNRLSRNDPGQEHPVIQHKRDGAVKDVPTALGGKWTEPPTPYATKYPYNHVRETESGHIEEYDDTPGAERYHRYHTSGTFEEIHPNGTTVQKIVGDQFQITKGNDHVLVNGDVRINVDKSAKIRINNQVDVEVVAGDVNIVVQQGNVSLRVEDGDVSEYVNGDVQQEITGNVESEIDKNMTMRVGGKMDIRSRGTMTFRAPRINLNS